MHKVSDNPLKNRTISATPLMVVTALFVTLYLVSNIMAVKVISLFGLFYFDAGTITFPFAYMLGDVLTELWGFRTAKRVIWLTFVCNIVLGSLAGFLCGELSNAWLMERIKIKMRGHHLWVRTIGSSAVGYMFDTLPFVLIAFLGTVSTHDLLYMIVFQYVSKLLIEALFGTPMAYAVIRWVRRGVIRVENRES